MKFHQVSGWLAVLCMLGILAVTARGALAGDKVSPVLPGQAELTSGDQASGDSQADSAVAAVYGQKFRHVPTGARKLIVLSFDDGPHPTRTAQVMAILKENDVSANFFWIGRNVQQYPDVARRVVDAGYEVGNHSMNHPNLRKQSLETIRKEIGDDQKLIEETTGCRPHLFRPPGGFVDADVQKVCREDELAICLWSVDPKDWAKGSTPQSIHDIVLKTAHAGAIICMHDIHQNTVEALPSIIRDLKAQGYEFTTISRLLEARDTSAPAEGADPAGAAGNPPLDMSSPLTISLQESDM